jgi:hypothetical protein
MRRIPLFFALSAIIVLQLPAQESYLGAVAPIMKSIHEERGFPMDYAHRNGLSVDAWQRRGRAEVQRCLSYAPKSVPLDVRVHSVSKREGYEVRVISFAGSAHYRVPALQKPACKLLILRGRGSWLPRLVFGLHDARRATATSFAVEGDVAHWGHADSLTVVAGIRAARVSKRWPGRT